MLIAKAFEANYTQLTSVGKALSRFQFHGKQKMVERGPCRDKMIPLFVEALGRAGRVS